MYTFDSNIYIWGFLEWHESEIESTNWLSNVEEKIIIPYIILSEVLTILTYKSNKDLANKFLNFIESDERFVIVHTDIEESLLLWKNIPKNIAHADIVLLYTALKYWAELITYDKQLKKLYIKIKK